MISIFSSLKTYFTSHPFNPDELLKKRWVDLGLSKEWCCQDMEAVRFLFKTSLIYPIVGFQSSTQNTAYAHGLYFKAGKLHMLVEGKFEPITEKVAKRFKWATACKWLPVEGQKIVEIGHENEGSWTYLAKQGLTKLDRWKYDQFIPVTRLSLREQQQLIDHASQGKKKSGCVFQLVTYPRDVLTANAWTQNLHLYQPVHAAIRLINEEGFVYSTSFGVPEEEMSYRNGYFNCLSAVNGTPTILDYEEFRQHEGKLTTSIWISSDTCTKLLKKIQNWHETGIRFHFMQQNCNSFSVKLLKAAGVKIDISSNVNQWLAKLLPKQLQYLNKAVTHSQIVMVLSKVFFLVQIVVSWVFRCLQILFFNLLLATLGANRGSPLKAKKIHSIDDDFPEFKRLRFSLFNNKVQKFDAPFKTIEWQLDQPTTWVHSYRGPSLSIVPPGKGLARRREDEALKTQLQELYQRQL